MIERALRSELLDRTEHVVASSERVLDESRKAIPRLPLEIDH